MKKLYTLILAAVTVALVGCGGISATAYNDTIVDMHSATADSLGVKMERIFDYANTSKEQAQTLVDELNAQYDANIAKLGGMKVPETATELHKSATEVFTYVKSNILPLFSESLKYEPESDEWYDVWSRIEERGNTASDLEDRMIEEQEKFAEAVGLDLQ